MLYQLYYIFYNLFYFLLFFLIIRISNFLRALPKTLQIDVLYKLRSYLNTTLKDKITKISNQPLRYIKEKTGLQRFLSFPAVELVGENIDDMILYKGKF